MLKKKPFPLIIAILYLAIPSFSQTNTNKSALNASAKLFAVQEKNSLKTLLSVASVKSWKLLVKTQTGIATLVGMDQFGYPLYVSTDNTITAASSTGTNQLWSGGSLGLNLNGGSNALKGKLGIWDGGKVNLTHVEMRTRIVQKDNASAPQDHSTHVSGIMINTGINPLAKGMAYGCQQLVAYDYLSHISEMAAEGSNLLVSNHSYTSIAGWNYNDGDKRWEFYGKSGDAEDYKFGYYNDEAKQWDEIAYNAPFYLIVKAAGNNRSQKGPAIGDTYFRPDANGVMANAGNRPAGLSSNDGYDIIATYGTSKNILTVGAIQPFASAYTSANDIVLADFSSWGPTDDGRIKPDIVADGVTILSSTSVSDNSYASYSGTSMASPVVAGSVFLLQEYYSQLHAGAFMRSATLKGLLIHTALEAGTTPGPDYQFGWGVANMQKAGKVIKSGNTGDFIYENTLENAGSFSLPLTASGKGPLTATICWTDPQSTVELIDVLNNRSPKLVNDLDLRIKRGGTEYLPWKLSPLVPSSAAVKGDNITDNVEKIEIPDAVPGEVYTLEITHKGTLAKDRQAYSLIISGAGGKAYCTPSLTTGARINNVQIGSFTNNISGGCLAYRRFENSRIDLQNDVAFTITTGDCASPSARMVKIFIDYNQDGDFNDAGETVATSNVTGTSFSGSFNVFNNVTPGFATILRVEVKETSDASTITGCEMSGNGEVQDYTVIFSAPSNDVGIAGITVPEAFTCASLKQSVSVKIKNNGTLAQSNINVSTSIKNGDASIATLNAIYPGTIAPGKEVTFTYPSTFIALAGNTYTLTTETLLPGDQNISNNQQISVISINSAGLPPSGLSAQLCENKINLKAINAGGGQLFWYESPVSGNIIASGYDTSTTIITSDKIYYAAINDVMSSGGLLNKSISNTGRYDNLTNNYIKFTTSVPLTIESVRLYTGNAGRLKFTLGKVVDATHYITISTSTIDVFATDPTPNPGTQTNYEPADAGAVFNLNLPVPSIGDYLLIVECLDGATLFYNNGIVANPYPITVPNVISITGNSATAEGNPDFYKRIYIGLYDIAVKLYGCASARIPVKATDCNNRTVTDLKIEPNPASDVFRIKLDLAVSANLYLSIMNMAGQKVYSGVYGGFAGSFSKEITPGYLAPGVYIIKVQHGGNIYTRKLIISGK